MTNPSPSPETSPQAATLGGVTFQAPASGGGSSDSLYGTGAWGSQNINMSGLPIVVVQALAQAGVDTSQPVKGADVAKALAQIHDPAAIAQLQQLLFYSGFYTNGTTLADLQLGSFGNKDTAALGNAVQTAGRTDQPLGTYLTARASTGAAQGVINQSSGVGITPITAPSQDTEDYALRSAAQSLLGREPSPADLAGFRAYFDQAYEQGQKQAQQAAAQQQAANMPDATTLGGAMTRLGVANPATGVPLGDAAEAPPATFARTVSPGMRAAPGSTNADTMATGLPPADNSAGVAAFNTQRAADVNTLNQFNAANTTAGQTPVVQGAPDVTAAAQAYLQAHDQGAIQTQNAISAYGQILKFIQGNGAI